MTKQSIVQERREKVSLCLAKSMTRVEDIARQINADPKDIHNDLYWMRKNSRKWLSNHTLDGYIFETRRTIDQLQDIELELQSMRSKTTSIDDKLKIMRQLTEVINLRWVIQGDGPTLMNIRTVNDDGR